MQTVLPASEVEPAGQLAQEAEPWFGLNVPAEQLEHEVMPEALWKLAAAQGVHCANAAAGEYWPDGQAVHEPAPAIGLMNPALQFRQAVAAAAVVYCPGLHLEHEEAPAAENVPAIHTVQAPFDL